MITNRRFPLASLRPTFVACIAAALATAACGGGGGGTTATGGASATGGSTATGGVTATGGATASGGATATGGSTATGGATATGGSTATGGVTATGGATASGGATATGGGAGGTTAAGGAAGGHGGSAGASAAGGAAGGHGGSTTACAGNAISLSANGTGSASDAAHARVMADLMTDLPIGNANRTIEFWAYVRSTDWVGETNTIYEYGTQGATAAGFGLDFGGNAGTIDPYTNGGFDNDNQATGLSTSMNQWVHFAMTWDGTAVRTYVNGAVKSTKMGSGGTTMLATAQTQLTIGCNNPRFSCFGGYIDEFRVWKVARTAAEIMANYNKGLTGAETGLVGYWRFNEAPGATAAADSVTVAGHTAHPGMPMAVMASQTPTFVTPATPVPITCP